MQQHPSGINALMQLSVTEYRELKNLLTEEDVIPSTPLSSPSSLLSEADLINWIDLEELLDQSDPLRPALDDLKTKSTVFPPCQLTKVSNFFLKWFLIKFLSSLYPFGACRSVLYPN